MRANFSAEYFAFFTIFAQNPVACAELPHSCLPLDSSAFQPITPRFPSMQKRSPPHTLRRVIPAMGPIDSASLLVAYILSFIKAIVLFKVVTFLPIIWIAGLLILLKTIGLLIFWVLLVMAIMSWVSQGRSPIEYVLIQLADPLLRPIRRLLPAMGGIDFSPMILVLLLYVINMGVAEVLQATGNMLLPGLWMAL